MSTTAVVSGLVAVGASAAAAITDVWKFKVYNVLTVPLLILGLIYCGVSAGWPGFVQSFYGALFGFGIMIVPYAFGGIGAGDVKFLAAIGAWLGVPMIYGVALIGCFATGLYAVGTAVAHGRAKEMCLNLKIMIYRLLTIGRYFRSHNKMESDYEIDVHKVCREGVVSRPAKTFCGPLTGAKMMTHRLLTIGHYLRAGDEIDRVQDIALQDDRRSRLVPISAMMAVGVLLNVLCRMWVG